LTTKRNLALKGDDSAPFNRRVTTQLSTRGEGVEEVTLEMSAEEAEGTKVPSWQSTNKL
jgi:hypothetical protein